MRAPYQKSAFSEKDERAFMRTFRDATQCWGCGSPNDGTVVGCHLNSVGMGHGTGIKTRGAAFPGCSLCHEIVDRRGQYSQPKWDGVRYQIIYRVAQTALRHIAMAWRDR
jgi:hypothetical protein